MKSFFRGIVALIIVSSILLFSDLQNRNRTNLARQINERVQALAIKGKVYNLGLCYFAPEASHDELLKGLWQRLKELGFVRDSNLIVKESHSNAEIGNISSILLNLDNQNFDLIMVTSTPCVTAALATIKKHKVAFTYCSDPIAAGAGKSYTDHAKGITGIGSFPPVEKTIEFILETVPGTKKIGTIYNNSEANSRSVVSLMHKVAEQKGFTLVEVPVVNTSEVFQATQVILSKGIDALYISGDNTAIQAFDVIAALCNKSKMPVVVNDMPLIGRGALAAMGPGWRGVGYHTGDLVGLMLNGASPDTIPLENYVNEEVSVDLEKAKSLGLRIPEKYLTSAKPPAEVKIRKLAMVHYVDSPNSEDCEKGIRKALDDNNLKEGINYTLKVYNAQGDMSTLNSIAGTISNEKWDLVFVTSTPTIQILSKKLKNQKMVFTNVGDPLAAGLGKSFEDHLPDICGVSTMSDFEGMIKLVLNLQPGVKRIGTVFTPAEINSVIYKDKLNDAAAKNGIKLVAAPASSVTEILDAANSLVVEKIDAICQISDNLTGSSGSAIQKVSRDNKVPFYGFVTQLINGAVAVCARDYFQAGYDAGIMGVDILGGKKPAQISFHVVSKTTFLINKEVATYYNIPVTDKLFTKFPEIKISKN
jgi:ABC-type uncharacterized transport system substrate-binding protein